VLRPSKFWTERVALNITVTRLVIKLCNFQITHTCYVWLPRMKYSSHIQWSINILNHLDIYWKLNLKLIHKRVTLFL